MNAAAWDEVAAERQAWLDEKGLDAPFFAAGGVELSALEREALGDVRDRKVLHLQCATGEDSLSLANLGAAVTGADISPEEIALARAKASAAGLDVAFVVADVQELPAPLRRGEFDLVYTGLGAIVWLDDLGGWARGVADALRPGGRFVLYEQHPAAFVFEEIAGRLVVVHSYFDGEPEYIQGWSHFPAVAHGETKAEFSWTVGGLVTALGHAGLATTRLEELPHLERWYGQPFPHLAEADRGKVPLGLLIVAGKPA